MDVLRQLVGGEVTARGGNRCVVFLPGGVLLDEGGENVEIETLEIPLLLEEPGLELGAASEGEAGQERAAVEIGRPTEGLDPVATFGEPGEGDEVGEDTLRVEPDVVARGEQKVRVGQSTAQVR
jgi:hypothetical protein